MRKIQQRSNCPISFSLDYLGDKWVLLIIRDIIFSKKVNFKDFLNADEGIATNVLTDRLKMLETHHFIRSFKDKELKTRKVYELTQKGKDLVPYLLEMMIWSNKYGKFNAEDSKALNVFVTAVKKDRQGIIDRLLA